MASADFDKDGKRDLVISVPAITAIALGNGDGSFQTTTSQLLYPPQGAASYQQYSTAEPAILAADFDGNGTVDLALTNRLERRMYIALNDGSGKFTRSAPADYAADVADDTNVLLSADLNGDGLPDIVATSYTAGTIQVFLSKALMTVPAVAVSTAMTQVAAGNPVTLTAKVTSSIRPYPPAR